jgi:hypothetical protein
MECEGFVRPTGHLGKPLTLTHWSCQLIYRPSHFCALTHPPLTAQCPLTLNAFHVLPSHNILQTHCPCLNGLCRICFWLGSPQGGANMPPVNTGWGSAWPNLCSSRSRHMRGDSSDMHQDGSVPGGSGVKEVPFAPHVCAGHACSMLHLLHDYNHLLLATN